MKNGFFTGLLFSVVQRKKSGDEKEGTQAIYNKSKV
jgi:hypothetical protein